jgi:hypothetical protein
MVVSINLTSELWAQRSPIELIRFFIAVFVLRALPLSYIRINGRRVSIPRPRAYDAVKNCCQKTLIVLYSTY